MSSADEPPAGRQAPYSAMRPRRARKLLLLKWGDEYQIKAPRYWPRRPNWSALARATGELMTAPDPDELARMVLRHHVARIAMEYHNRVAREERDRPPPPLAQVVPLRLSMADASVRRLDERPARAGLT
jgi:hypothetical protein